jgi:hypothetical protein
MSAAHSIEIFQFFFILLSTYFNGLTFIRV